MTNCSQKGKEVNKVVAQPPGIQINQLMCCEVPGDEPIVKFINVLDPVKFAPGITVTKEYGTMKLQVSLWLIYFSWNKLCTPFLTSAHCI